MVFCLSTLGGSLSCDFVHARFNCLGAATL